MDFVILDRSLSIIFSNEPAITISSGHPNFAEIKALALEFMGRAHALPVSVEKRIRHLASISESIAEASARKIIVKGGIPYYKGVPIKGRIAAVFMEALKQGGNLLALCRFIMRARENPDPNAIEQLYDFMEHNKMMIAEDGCFYAYKRVRGDWHDFHSGTFDYSPGKTPQMPREACDPDPHRTCSRGIHVASLDYARDFYAGGYGLLIICKVDPRHVVAVPVDYNRQKMRVCQLEAIGRHADDKTEVFDQISVPQHKEAERILDSGVAIGAPITWRVNGVAASGTIAAVVCAQQSALATMNRLALNPGRVRFADLSDEDRVLIMTDKNTVSVLTLKRAKAILESSLSDAQKRERAIKPGVTLTWTSQAGGRAKTKTGVALGLVKAMTSIQKTLKALKDVPSHRKMFDLDISACDRVVVCVKDPKKGDLYYAPRVNKQLIVKTSR